MDLLTPCTLCVVLGFVPVESSLPAAIGHSPSSTQFGLYAAQGFPVWTWHSLQPWTAELQYPLPYRMWPQGLESPQDLPLEPIREDWTEEPPWGLQHLDQP